ncbi:MAG: glycosyltransferase family 2 protein [Leptospirales bacterium]|nr:glycosyltransferase family 2 protein [Leptospirales bacterium]
MEVLSILLFVLYGLDIALLFFFGVHTYVMVLLYRRNSKYCDSGAERPPIDLSSVTARKLPMVTLQLPIYNEYYVVDRLLESAVRLQWPREKLEIQVLDDSTDETADKVARLVQGYRDLGYNMVHIHRTNRQGHKAGALKHGLELAAGDYIAIFDADFIPNPEFLIRTMPYFEEQGIGMVQTRWGHINADYSILTKAQSMGIDGHFMIEQVARNGNHLWMNFNGTGGIWKRECILEAGNWQGDTLTEDFDLSYRAELAGWRFRYFKDIVNPAELPATIAAFKSQQFRWCKGSIQTALKLIPRILRSDVNWKIKAEAVTHLVNYSVHPLMIFNMLMTLPLLLLDGWSVYHMRDFSVVSLFAVAACMSVGTLGPMVFYVYSQRELHKDWLQRIVWLPVLMMIGTGIAVKLTRAWFEAILGVQSSFKRTPKLRLESRADRVLERQRYRLPLDHLVWLELAMGLYCATCAWLSYSFDLWMLTPFMAIYASGFFYAGLGSIVEAFQQLRQSRESESIARAA